MQPVWQLLLNSNKVTCAEPAHTAPRLVQKKIAQCMATAEDSRLQADNCAVQMHNLEVLAVAPCSLPYDAISSLHYAFMALRVAQQVAPSLVFLVLAVAGFCLVGGFLFACCLSVGLQPGSCAEPARIAPRLVQKKS